MKYLYIFRATMAAILIAMAIIAIVQASALPAEQAPEPTPEPSEVVTPEPAELTAGEVETIRTEDDRIEAALIEQGYYRDDIPLSYLEQDYLHTAADEFGIDYYVMVGLIERETNFRNITGDGGYAFGYCQIWLKWWGDLMADIGATDLMDPQDNFRTAAAILAQHSKRYGSIEDALTAYNTNHPGESEYASDVLARAEKWRVSDV